MLTVFRFFVLMITQKKYIKLSFMTFYVIKQSYAKYILFHAKNFFSTFIFKKPAKHYEVIR